MLLSLQNRRPDYISVFIDKLVSWEAVSSRLEKAKAVIAEREREEERKRREKKEKSTTGQEATPTPEILADIDTD
jgi:Fe-Mn family superoxide dismutase